MELVSLKSFMELGFSLLGTMQFQQAHSPVAKSIGDITRVTGLQSFLDVINRTLKVATALPEIGHVGMCHAVIGDDLKSVCPKRFVISPVADLLMCHDSKQHAGADEQSRLRMPVLLLLD